MKHQKQIKQLQKSLQAASRKETKEWFEAYLKNAISYRGVKMPEITKILKDWRKSNGIDELDVKLQLDYATELLRQSYAEDKFAGIIFMQKFLVKELPFNIFLVEIDKLFKSKALFDWSTTDWLNTKVLSPLVDIHRDNAAKSLATWAKKKNLWQRRSSIVSLRGAVPHKDLHIYFDHVIKQLLPSDERFIQTGIGWVLSDLKKAFPKSAKPLIEKYRHQLSSEVIRRHIEGKSR